MKLKVLILVVVAFFGLVNGLQEESCNTFAARECKSVGNWTSGTCNSIYGHYSGNENNLRKLMADHLQDSFKFLLMVLFEIVLYNKTENPSSPYPRALY
jgi:hypothetical protein